MWIRRRGKRHRFTLPPPVEEDRAAGAAHRAWESAQRLAAVFAEEDAEIDARLGEVVMGEWKFKCSFCGSRFSLAQQLEAHERECGTVVPDKEVSIMPGKGARPITCKRCGIVSASLNAHNQHALTAHREEELAHRRELAAARKRDEGRTEPADIPDVPAEIPTRARAARGAFPAAEHAGPVPVEGAHAEGNGNGHGRSGRAAGTGIAAPGVRCPLCDGPLPGTTAQLVTEFTRAGVSEVQAFEFARIARRTLGAACA